jgi:hypothetical protein
LNDDPYQRPDYRMSPAPPERRKRKGLRIFLGSAGGLIVLLIIVAVAASHPKTAAPASTPAAPASPAAVATSAAPAPPPPPHVLLSFSGSGIENSAPFLVPGQVTVKYSYDCSSTGSSGNFIADLMYGNQSSLSSDDQSIANELGTGGGQTTTIYPQDPGHDYYLAVNSECSWSITVTGT